MPIIMNISVVIPAFNEEKRIGKTLNEVIEYLKKKKFRYEVIVIDDGSYDSTASVVSCFLDKNVRLIKNRRNRGKGYTFKRGVLKSRYEYILFTDADLSTPIEELERFLLYIHDFDVVIGSRRFEKSKVLRPPTLFRKLASRTFNILVKMTVMDGFDDTQCGFKLFKRDSIRKIAKLQRINRFCFDVEIIFIATVNSYPVKQLPVTWSAKRGGHFVNIIRMFFDLLIIKFNYISGKYKI